jgi:hypothetical protein
MRRRKFIALLGAAATCPLAARAQHVAIPVIGFLSGRAPAESGNLVTAFRAGLREGGTSRMITSQSSIAGRRGNMIGCRGSQQNSSDGRCPSSSR